jgi:molecular chaperone GrpE
VAFIQNRRSKQAVMSNGNVKSHDSDEKNERQQQAQPQAAEPEGSAATGPSGHAAETESRVLALQAELDALRDQLLRTAADFENSRKRMVREKEEAIRYANAALLADVVPIIDDFERAIQSAGESKEFEAFYAGVSLIEKQLVAVLERNWGLKRFSAAGEPFDPEKHEAIAAEESEAHDKELVLEEYQKGYLLHDRVLRPAKVKVAKPVALPAPPEGNARSKEEQ